MSRAYIKVNSVTYAIKVRNVLNANGIYAQVVRNTNSYRNEGCGYSVVINGDLSRAEEILRRNNIKFLGTGEVRERL